MKPVRRPNVVRLAPLAGLLAPALPAAAQYYTLTDLGAFDGAPTHAQGISPSGAVAGYWEDDQRVPHAFVWTPGGGLQDIGDLGGGRSSAAAINSAGAVAGDSRTDAGADHAFVWDPEVGMTDLGTLGGDSSAAADLNDDGTVVGVSLQADNRPRGFRWTSAGGMKSLGTLNQGQASDARRINAAGVIVGTSIKNGQPTPFMWTAGGGMVALSGATLMHSATAISDVGTASGSGDDPGYPELTGYFWSSGNGERILNETNGYEQATTMATYEALSVNSAGLLVGWGETPDDQERAFAWESRYETVNLNSAIPSASGWTLRRATDINDAGQIVGTGLAPDGLEHAFLLTPAPTQPVIYVKSGPGDAGDGLSWATAYTRLGDAFLAAALGSGVQQIWVAQGDYAPDLPSLPENPRTVKFLIAEGFQVYGGFAGNEISIDQRDWAAHPTILEGDLAGDDQPGFGNTDDNANSIVKAIGFVEGTSARLDGFTVRGGNADDYPTSRRGGGLYAVLAELDLSHCLFVSNFADEGGGFWATNGVFRLTDCEFSNNAAYEAGGMHVDGSGGRISRCRFIENQSINERAGGLQADMTSHARSLIIDRCLFQGNSSNEGTGGLDAHSDSNLGVFNCGFIGNASAHGPAGGAAMGGDMDIANCLFLANSGAFAGGLSAGGGNVPARLTDCTVAYNTTDDEKGAGIVIPSGVLKITNCIVWGNEAVAIPSEIVQIAGKGVPAINYSAVQFWSGDLGGQGNAGDNPRFTDTFGGDGVKGAGDEDLSLKIDSPYLDAGDNTAVPFDAADLDGDGKLFEPLPLDLAEHDRFVAVPGVPPKGKGKAPFVDLGPFEFVPASCPPDVTGDGVLDLFDFLGFVNLFNGHDPRADIDGNGSFDLFDFLAFVNLFNAGC